MMLRTSAYCIVIVAVFLPCAASASLVTYYNFNAYDGNSSSINATNGNGSITLQSDGGVWPADELGNPTGTTLNAVGVDPAGTALSLGNNGGATGVRTLTLGFSSVGSKDLVLSFASAGAESAYSSAHVEYSINGTDFFDGGITFDPAAGGSFTVLTQSLSGIAALNNTATAFVRLTLSGPNLNMQQDLDIDNLQINGVAVPEAHALAMMAIAGLLFWIVARRRHDDRSERLPSDAHVLPVV